MKTGNVISFEPSPKRDVEVRITKEELFSAISEPAGPIKVSEVGGYDVVEGWPKKLSTNPGHQGWTFGAGQSVFAESPDRVYVVQRGELPEIPRPMARKLSDLQGVGHARAKQVALVVQEDLRFVDQAPKGAGMHDAVAVPLKIISRGRILFIQTPAPGPQGVTGKGGKAGREGHDIKSRNKSIQGG